MKSTVKLLTTREICTKLKQRYLEIANNMKNYYYKNQYYKNVATIIFISPFST